MGMADQTCVPRQCGNVREVRWRHALAGGCHRTGRCRAANGPAWPWPAASADGASPGTYAWTVAAAVQLARAGPRPLQSQQVLRRGRIGAAVRAEVGVGAVGRDVEPRWSAISVFGSRVVAVQGLGPPARAGGVQVFGHSLRFLAIHLSFA